MDPLSMTDPDLALHMRGLDDTDLITFLANLDHADTEQRNRPANLARSARYYAEHYSWPVFPLVPRSKRPLTEYGFKDATVDLDQIRAWWTRWPEANIGIPTGRREQGGCGYDVIDVDGLDGYASIAQLQHADCPPDCCATTICRNSALPEILARSATPGDATRERPRAPGSHYFSLAAGTSCTTRALPGIDLRGDGGYIVAPPSVGPDGGRYFWTLRPPAPRG